MADDDLHIHKDEPPENPQDWQRVHRAVHRTEVTWPLLGPVYAVLSNWKAIAIGLAFIVAINNPKLINAAKAILEVFK